MKKFTINEIAILPKDIERLAEISEKEGYRFVRKLVDEWTSGKNRFDKSGEVIYGAFANASLIGVCGLNQDPYAEQSGVGRLRHLYIDCEYRNNGIARILVSRCLENTSGHFDRIRLRTPNDHVNRFYAYMGFSEVNESAATHEILLFDRNA